MAVRLWANDGTDCASKSTVHRDRATYLRSAGTVARAGIRGELFSIIVWDFLFTFGSDTAEPHAVAMQLGQVQTGYAYFRQRLSKAREVWPEQNESACVNNVTGEGSCGKVNCLRGRCQLRRHEFRSESSSQWRGRLNVRFPLARLTLTTFPEPAFAPLREGERADGLLLICQRRG